MKSDTKVSLSGGFDTKAFKFRKPLIGTVMLVGTMGLINGQAWAHSIDYLAANISPLASFNGGSGNFTLNDPVASGSSITFGLTFSINASGSTTTYPRTVSFGATTESKPAGAADASVSGLNACTFTGTTSSCLNSVTVVAPAVPGTYSVKIQPTSDVGTGKGLSPGGGLVLSFTVADPVTPVAMNTVLTLGLEQSCIYYRQDSTDVTAQVMGSDGNPVVAGYVDFMVEGYGYVGSAVTDHDGKAVYEVNTDWLDVGDHTVVAAFQGDGYYNASAHSATLGVQYLFAGYKQPINADGSSVFSGRVVSVKIKIADYYGYPVSDAAAHVFFAAGTPAVIGNDAEALANTSPDGGNTMRYDAAADQYVFNWDVNGLTNGNYSIRTGLGEGTACDARTAVVSLNKKKGK